MLTGGDLVVLCLGVYAQLPKLPVKVGHIVGNALFNRSEVMVLQLLTLGRACAEQRSARENQIGAL